MSKGGRRTGAGRKPGVPNRVTLEIRSLAQEYGPKAIERLAWLAEQADSQQTQAYACQALLDRGFGRPTPPAANARGDKPVEIAVYWRHSQNDQNEELSEP
jgi:hypothetical protein